MARRTPVGGAGADADVRRDLVEVYALNERLNQHMLTALDRAAWRAAPPDPRGRTIAAIFTHVHNTRRKWIRLNAPHLGVPPLLNRSRCTQAQARVAMRVSGARCTTMLAEALVEHTGRITAFRRDAWMPVWALGAPMFSYMIMHEAHHRGQVCMLAHQLGFPLPREAAYGLWKWEAWWHGSHSSPLG